MDFQINQRVNVSYIVTESWESKSWLKNAIIKGIQVVYNDVIFHIVADEFTEKSDFCKFPTGGFFYASAYEIN